MTFKPQAILVPLDGSDIAERALQTAVEIAKQSGARLHLIQVYYPAYASANVGVGLAMKGFDNNLMADGKTYLQEQLTKLANDGFTNAEAHMIQGNVKQTIALTYPREHHIDLIVIGATGLDSFSQTVLGSVTGFVVNKAKATVLVVKPKEKKD